MLKKGSTGLMQGEETGLLAPRPADTPGRFHEQDGHRVGTHLWVPSDKPCKNDRKTKAQ